MRIVIEIDGVELVRTTEQPEVTGGIIPELSLGATLSDATLPAKLLKAAAALGAENAGSGPAEIADMDMADTLISAAHGAIAGEASDDMDAGAGPDGPSDKAPAKKTKKKK